MYWVLKANMYLFNMKIKNTSGGYYVISEGIFVICHKNLYQGEL